MGIEPITSYVSHACASVTIFIRTKQIHRLKEDYINKQVCQIQDLNVYHLLSKYTVNGINLFLITT